MDPHNPLIERAGMAANETRYCRDCKHYQHEGCAHPNNVELSLVLGEPRKKNSAEYLRQEHHGDDYKACEPAGRWWEAK